MAYTFDENLFSDLYKEAYGHRPSLDESIKWNSMSDDEKQQEWDMLCKVHEQAVEDEQAEQAKAVQQFNEKIEELISLGADSRKTAIRWIVDSMDINKKYIEFYGAEVICHQMGIPYSMESEINEAIS